MAEKLVEVAGQVVAFPADMSDAQINAILTNQSSKSSFLTGLGEPISGLEQLAGKAVEAVYPSPGVKQLNQELRQRQMAEEEALQGARNLRGDSGIDWARLGGNAATLAIPTVGAEAVLSKAIPSIGARAGIIGAGESAVMPTDVENFWTDKAKQAGTGFVAGVAGQKLISAGGRVLSPIIEGSEKKLRDLGVMPTVGQSLGKSAKGIEDFLSKLPVIGQFVQDAKEDSYDSFRTAIINKGLARVDDKLPKGTTGYDAINYAFKVKDAKYDEALKGTKFVLDNPALTKILSTSQQQFDTAAQKDLYDNILTNNVYSYFQKGQEIEGAAFKKMTSDLNDKIFTYRNKGEVELANALQNTLNDIKSVFNRQNPKQSSELRRVDALYRDLNIITDASGKSYTGKFTPEQYAQSVKENAAGRKKREFGKGKALNQQEAVAGIEVLSPNAKDLSQQVAAGAAGGYGAFATDPITALAFGVLSPALYAKGSRKAIDAAISKRPEIVKQVGDLIKRTSASTGGLFGQNFMYQRDVAEKNK